MVAYMASFAFGVALVLLVWSIAADRRIRVLEDRLARQGKRHGEE